MLQRKEAMAAQRLMVLAQEIVYFR